MRLADWQTRFGAFVSERLQRPFAWGSNDCCLFAADAVQALTGADPAAGLRTYQTERGAARVVKRLGGLRAIATRALGAEVRPVYAGVGDVVLLTNAGREMLAVCNGVTAIGPGATGLMVLSMDAALAAWKV